MEEFIKKISAMRQAQRDYFKSRDPLNLQTAKRLEAEVDRELSILTATANPKQVTCNHPKLF